MFWLYRLYNFFQLLSVGIPTFTIKIKKSSPCFKKDSRVEFSMVKTNRYIVLGFVENTTYCALFRIEVLNVVE